MKSTLMTAMLLTSFCLIGWGLGITVPKAAQAADPSRVVVLDTSFISSEICVLVVHRSRMVNRTPVARCATVAELKDLVR